jgi:uncharacterized protein
MANTRFPIKPLTQVAVFVVLVFAVPWIVAPWLPQQPQNTREVILSFLPGVWAPTVLAIGMVAATGGLRAVGRELIDRLRYRRGHWVWFVAAVATPALFTAVGVLLARATGDGQPVIPASVFGTVVINALVTGAVGEELGWRGFVLSRLALRMSHQWGALAMSVLWGLWHLPIFLFPESPYASWPLLPALLAIVGFGLFMASLFHSTQGSVIATILAHLSLNISLGVGGVQLSSGVFWWTLAGMFMVLAGWRHWRLARLATCPCTNSSKYPS